jgi:hypothetical protein
MTILENISKQIIENYKNGNSQKRVLLQTIKAALAMVEKERRDTLPDEEAIKVLRKELKQRVDAKQQYAAASRTDLVEKMDFETSVLKEFLPSQMSERNIEKIVLEVISQSDDKSFGPVMGKVMNKLNGQADGSLVSQILKKHL